MWGSLLILTTGICIAILEAPGLWRARRRKELTVFILLLLLGITTGLLQAWGIRFPTPTSIITTCFKPISDALLSLME